VARELHKQAYQDALIQRYQHLPEIKRIIRHRHLPTPIYKVSLHLGCCPTFFYLSCLGSGGLDLRALRRPWPWSDHLEHALPVI
jgi:hypothetical protein